MPERIGLGLGKSANKRDASVFEEQRGHSEDRESSVFGMVVVVKTEQQRLLLFSDTEPAFCSGTVGVLMNGLFEQFARAIALLDVRHPIRRQDLLNDTFRLNGEGNLEFFMRLLIT